MNMLAISEAEATPVADRPDDLVGISQCAKKFGVNKSTISRQLKKRQFKNWGSESAPLVSLAEVDRVRKGDLNPAQQRQPAASVPKSVPEGPSYTSERAAREAVNRKRDEIALAEKLGTILDRADVDADFETFARLLREHLRQRATTLVMELDQLPTVAAKAAHLVEADEQLLDDLAAKVEVLANEAG